MNSQGTSRRGFIKTAAAASTVYSLLPDTILGANERVNIGMIGVGSKGGGHLKAFNRSGSRVVAVSDPDTDRMNKGGNVAKHRDFRKLLEMKDVDAVVISTPNHWHCLAAIWSLQAGKHAYVEKPVSHNIYEGRKMVEAARKYSLVCQTGTQQRSCPATRGAARDIREGKYGKVLWAHTSKLGSRKPIGKLSSPVKPPAGLDYNLWAGPAPMSPIIRKNFHYDWHWQWNWGDGELGNWGVHYVDDLRHILGWDDVPENVMAIGNRFWNDNGETPNMLMAMMEHRGVKVVVDIRNLPGIRGGSGGAIYLGSRGGNYIMCEKGYIKISRGGGKGYDLDGKMITQYRGDAGAAHIPNFINAVKANDSSKLNAEIEVGHQSTMMCHLGNISWRVGQEASVDELKSAVKGSEDAVNTLNSMLTQLSHNKVDLEKTPFIAGPKLSFDNRKEIFTGKHSKEANRYIRMESRKEFEVPDKV